MIWSIGCVRTGGEISLAERLSACQVGVYLPMGQTRTRKARRRGKTVYDRGPTPAFPGYLFVEDSTVTDRIYEEPGFYDFIRLEGERYLLPSEAIEGIRAMERRDMFSDQKPGQPRFTLGEVLRVPEGIFGDMKGRVTRYQDGDVWLDGLDFKWPVRFNGLILLKSEVVCA